MRTTFSALGQPRFRVFWWGSLFAQAGWWMKLFTLGWLLVELAVREGEPARAPLYVGLLGLAAAIPALTVVLFAGVLADRVDLRKLMFITQSCHAALACALAAIVASNGVSIGIIVAIAFVSACVQALDQPARQSIVLRLVTPQQLMSAIGLYTSSHTTAQIVGPSIAGILVGPLGTVGVLLLAAGSYVPMLFALARLGPVPPVAAAHPPLLESIGEGLRCVRADPVIRWTAIYTAVVSFFIRPYHLLLPAIAVGLLGVGARETSWLVSIIGVGALFGAAAVVLLANVERRGLGVLITTALAGVLFTVISFQTTLTGALICSALFGFVLTVFGGLTTSIMQMRAPDALRGRVMSVHTISISGSIPLGQLMIGALASAVGLPAVLLTAGVIVIGVALYGALRIPDLKGAVARPVAR